MQVWVMADDSGKVIGTMRGEPKEPYSPRTKPRHVEGEDAGIWVFPVTDDLREVRLVEEFHRLLRRHLPPARTGTSTSETCSS